MLTKLYSPNPNPREVRRIAERLQGGEIAILPTDTLYAFACSMQSKHAADEVARLKGFRLKQAKYALLCHSIAQASEYVRPMDRSLFALLKQSLPGPFTFVLEANGNVPRAILNGGRTIGIRVPDNDICRAIVEEVGCPLLCTSVRPIDADDEQEYYTDPELIHDRFGSRVGVVVDGGIAEPEGSTVVDCSDQPLILRQGKGIIDL